MLKSAGKFKEKQNIYIASKYLTQSIYSSQREKSNLIGKETLAAITWTTWWRLKLLVREYVNMLYPLIYHTEKGTLLLWPPSPKSINSIIWRNTSHKLRQIEDILQNAWPVLYKIIKVVKGKEKQRNCDRLEETKGQNKM